MEDKLITEPLFTYDNLFDNWENIKNDVKGFSRIYLWYNKFNAKIYIGSANGLYRRISNYYQPAHLKRPYPIMTAINKYGLNSFKLVILDIFGKGNNINPAEKLIREDYYLSKYLPEYNILEKGSSSINYKHSIIAKLRALALNRDKSTIVYSNEFILKQKSNKFGINNPMFGKKWSTETRKKIVKPIYVYDSATMKFLYLYSETVLAIKDLKMGYLTLKRCLLTKESFKGKIFSRIPIIKEN